MKNYFLKNILLVYCFTNHLRTLIVYRFYNILSNYNILINFFMFVFYNACNTIFKQ